VKISVTQEHIDKGERWSFHSCPLALAVTEASGNLAGVGTESIYPNWDKIGLTKITMPAEVANFRSRFDESSPVEPFEFEISI
jgi:hypothetical protein